MEALPRHLPAREVAQSLGVKTKTLAAWRARGKGPTGSFHISKTLVVYPRTAVEAFLAARVAESKREGQMEAMG